MNNPPPDKQTRAEVRRIIAAVLKLPARDCFRRKETPEWDSLKNLEVFFALEDAFAVEFGEEEFTALDSCEALARAIAAKRGEELDAP
ncbi:MAG: acyl carrier protein [Gammaproteobacteria bacterium]